MRSPEETLDVADSLRHFAAGDAAARERVVKICTLRIRAVANRMLSAHPGGGQCDADDEILVSTMERFHAVLTALDRAAPRFTLALAAAALKRVILELTARRIDSLHLAAGCGLPVASASTSSRWLVFFRSIDRLPPLHREVFHLVWFMGADPAVVSLLTGRSKRTVHRCWREARTTVAEVVREADPTASTEESTSFVAVA